MSFCSFAAVNDNTTISFDVRTRFNDYSWDTPAVDQLNNDNHFENLIGLNLDGSVADGMTFHLRLEKFGYFNSTGGDWGMGRGVLSQNDTDTRTYLAYVEAQDFFGWADYMRVGRQSLQIGTFIDGMADGLVFKKDVPEWSKAVFHFGGVALDGADADLNNDNDGLSAWFVDCQLEITEDLMGDFYYVNSKNPFASVTTANLNRAQAAMMDGFAGQYGWAGFGLTYDGLPDVVLYGEAVLSKWEHSLRVDGDERDGDTALVLGATWKAADKLVVGSKYMNVEDYFFAPTNAAGNNIFDTDTYLNDDVELWNVAGYRYDFNSWVTSLDYQLTDKVALTGIYETVNDNRTVVVDDDRAIFTGKVAYQYNDNAKITLSARHVDVAENTTTAVVSRIANGAAIYGNAGGANTGAAGEVNVDDVNTYRLELSINF